MLTRGVIRDLEVRHRDALDAFAGLFHRWNQKINLSAARSLKEIREHILDSLHVVPFLESAADVLDVGSGGGFPVAIAAICLSTTSFVSLEPVHKKQAFLRTAARELGLNLDARAERLEQHEGSNYDIAMSRATFDIVEWFRLAAPFVRPGGAILGFEGIERADLFHVERFPYGDLKSRSIVRLQT